MPRNQDFREKIHQANILVHQHEAHQYELLHPEVYSRQEQKRITKTLQEVDKLAENNQKIALDVGAGTGNLTGKLLRMGYKVTAIDISAEMLGILQQKYKSFLGNKLTIINSPIEDINFLSGEFDLITCYSVLHHLPNYVETIKELSVFLKKGGVLYVDHEASPFYWKKEPSGLAEFVKHIYFHSSPIFNAVYFRFIGLNVPSIDYTLSDYWHKKEHALNHGLIESFFKKAFSDFWRKDYHLNSAWVFNPLFYLYRLICSPEMSLWIAKK